MDLLLLPTENEHVAELRELFAGCLLGGAVGDALGAPFEGLWGDTIPEQAELLAGFGEFEGYPRGQYTDDTQLSLATVEAILEVGRVEPSEIATAIAALWANESVVGPGGACTRAAHAFLNGANWSTCGAPVGQAGNGTAMRTAALGLCYMTSPDDLPEAVADISRITHHDSRSVAGGVAVAKAVQILVSAEPSAPELCEAVASAMERCDGEFAGLVRDLPSRLSEPKAVALNQIAAAGQLRAEFDRPIITPFVVPTVLAALFAVLRHPKSWSDAVAYVIRLGGDVDTTGSIVGAIMGAKLGVSVIPAHLAEGVLDQERIRVLAARLHALVARS